MLRIFNRFRAQRTPDCERHSHWLRFFATGASVWPDSAPFGWGDIAAETTKIGPKVLLVVAHPDDESECAATIYRITRESGGIVDQAIVTDGAAGFHWAAPAEAFYGVPLASPSAASRHLRRIRRREVLEANRILGVRDTYFFDQKDTGFTFDPSEGLRAWDSALVRDALIRLIDREQYDVILILLPTADTHGHHQSVAILVLQAVAELPAEQRPAIVGVRTASADEDAVEFSSLPRFPLTRTVSSRANWSFDRKSPMADSPLDHSIVVHWVIAEHKSQGMFQMEFGRGRYERFWLFDVSGVSGRAKWERAFPDLPHPAKEQTYLHEVGRRTYA